MSSEPGSQQAKVEEIEEEVRAAYPIYEQPHEPGLEPFPIALKQEFRKLHRMILVGVDPKNKRAARTRALALTNLEDACMWAVKAHHQNG